VPSGDKFYSRASQLMGATGLRWAGKLNIPLYRLSGGRLMGKVNRAPVLLLTTTGRRSGQQRTAPVVYLDDGENPDAEVELGRERRQVRARVAEGEERAELWRRHNEQFSGFDHYEARTDRVIALFVLEPR